MLSASIEIIFQNAFCRSSTKFDMDTLVAVVIITASLQNCATSLVAVYWEWDTRPTYRLAPPCKLLVKEEGQAS